MYPGMIIGIAPAIRMMPDAMENFEIEGTPFITLVPEKEHILTMLGLRVGIIYHIQNLLNAKKAAREEAQRLALAEQQRLELERQEEESRRLREEEEAKRRAIAEAADEEARLAAEEELRKAEEARKASEAEAARLAEEEARKLKLQHGLHQKHCFQSKAEQISLQMEMASMIPLHSDLVLIM